VRDRSLLTFCRSVTGCCPRVGGREGAFRNSDSPRNTSFVKSRRAACRSIALNRGGVPRWPKCTASRSLPLVKLRHGRYVFLKACSYGAHPMLSTLGLWRMTAIAAVVAAGLGIETVWGAQQDKAIPPEIQTLGGGDTRNVGGGDARNGPRHHDYFVPDPCKILDFFRGLCPWQHGRPWAL
jgi:hypothetical protein